MGYFPRVPLVRAFDVLDHVIGEHEVVLWQSEADPWASAVCPRGQSFHHHVFR